MPTIKEALLAAADWLEANRDKHVQGTLAINEEGRHVTFDSPDAACFCALGRFGKEMGLKQVDTETYAELNDVLGSPVVDSIYRANDESYNWDLEGQAAPGDYTFAGLGGIEKLRRIANGLD